MYIFCLGKTLLILQDLRNVFCFDYVIRVMSPKIACHIHLRINEKSKLKLNKKIPPTPILETKQFFPVIMI